MQIEVLGDKAAGSYWCFTRTFCFLLQGNV